MFSLVPNSSKLALAALIAFCRKHHIQQVDCQQNTPHLALTGAREIPRGAFLSHIQEAQAKPSLKLAFSSLYTGLNLATHPLCRDPPQGFAAPIVAVLCNSALPLQLFDRQTGQVSGCHTQPSDS
jgi:hypothetical protein